MTGNTCDRDENDICYFLANVHYLRSSSFIVCKELEFFEIDGLSHNQYDLLIKYPLPSHIISNLLYSL